MTHLLGLGLAILSFHAPAPVQNLTVVNGAAVPIARAETAVEAQSAQLRRRWGTPLVRFAPGGWPVILQNDTGRIVAVGGIHTTTPAGTPEALIAVVAGGNWTVAFSHEVLEMLVDPYGGRVEVCDPVEGESYLLGGVQVSDFVFPNGHDQMGATAAAGGPGRS
jgi:hypothetical protein